jgi:Protein of unknown function (DUF2924)
VSTSRHPVAFGLDELRTLWRVTFRSSPPPAISKNLMTRFICWHIQEQAFAGIDPETAKHLDGLARGAKPGADHPSKARVGQKNKITWRWAKRGTRPSAPHDQTIVGGFPSAAQSFQLVAVEFVSCAASRRSCSRTSQ